MIEISNDSLEAGGSSNDNSSTGTCVHDAMSGCRDGLTVCEAPRFLLTMRRKTYERVLAT